MTLENGVEKTKEKYNEKLKPSDLSLVLFIESLISAKKFRKILDVSKKFYNGNKDPSVIYKIYYVLASAIILYPLVFMYRKIKYP